MLRSCGEWGAAVDSQWRIHLGNGQVVCFLQLPPQHLKPWVLEWANEARIQRTTVSRPSASNQGPSDWKLTNSVDKELSADLAILRKRIASLGIWNQVIQDHAEGIGFGTCPWCKNAREDWTHMWWSCPSFEQQRPDTMRAQATEAMPPSSGMGALPPCPGSCLATHFGLWRGPH